MLGIVLALKLPTILILAWVFLHPEESFHLGRRYWGVFTVVAVHILLALLSLTGEKSSLSEMFVAYPLIWSVLLRDRLRRLVPIPASIWLMAVGICLLLWFEETWVIVDHRSPPLRHYVHYFGFYLGVTATIVWLYTRYRYTALQTFVVGGLWGVLVEQQFAGPKMLASGAVVEALTFGLLHLPGVRLVSGGTPAALLRGVQPVESDEPVAGSLAVSGNHCAAACQLGNLVSRTPGSGLRPDGGALRLGIRSRPARFITF